MHAQKIALSLILVALSATALAQGAYRWKDKDGKVHYSDQPPPASQGTKVEKRLLANDAPVAPTLSYTLRQAMADYPVTLYTQAKCSNFCQDGRDYLTQRGVPFSENKLSNEAEQAELRKLLGSGELVIPILKVGGKLLKGYNRADWTNLLDAAGYPATKEPGVNAVASPMAAPKAEKTAPAKSTDARE